MIILPGGQTALLAADISPAHPGMGIVFLGRSLVSFIEYTLWGIGAEGTDLSAFLAKLRPAWVIH